MFWREHSYVAYSTTYVGYLTLRRKSAFLRRKKTSCSRYRPRILKIAEFGEKSSLYYYEQSLHFRSYLLSFNPRT